MLRKASDGDVWLNKKECSVIFCTLKREEQSNANVTQQYATANQQQEYHVATTVYSQRMIIIFFAIFRLTSYYTADRWKNEFNSTGSAKHGESAQYCICAGLGDCINFFSLIDLGCKDPVALTTVQGTALHHQRMPRRKPSSI